jgi:hypothetical protein
MKTRTSLKSGSTFNHNENMRVRSSVRAGGLGWNHNENIVEKSAPGSPSPRESAAMKVKSNVKAGNYPVTMDPLPWMSKR